MLPTPASDLTRRETLKPLGGDETGEFVKIDKGVLAELYTRLGEAIGAVERGNVRIGGWEALWGCTDAIWRTGKAGEGC